MGLDLLGLDLFSLDILSRTDFGVLIRKGEECGTVIMLYNLVNISCHLAPAWHHNGAIYYAETCHKSNHLFLIFGCISDILTQKTGC